MCNWMLDLIVLLSDYVNNKASLGITVTHELVELAQDHQVAPIVFFQTKDKSLYQYYLGAISSYTKRQNLLCQITDALGDILFYSVKGLSVAQYYPIPQLRTMGDCNVIVHEKDKERARDVLISLGFTDNTSDWKEKEWVFKKQGLEFELHHRLLYEQVMNEPQEIAFTDMAWDYVNNHELNVNFHFVFLLLHLKKHFLYQGVGIRQFMDLAVMCKNAYLDREQVQTFLHQAGIEKFAGICSALCLRWFGISFPIETPKISDEFFDSATATILSNGVFGFETPINVEKRLLNNIRKSGKVGAVIDHLFPSYKDCSITPKYKWIKGKPYLMPALWIYRFFWALFSGKGKTSMEYVSTVASSDKAMAEREKELATWGL